MPSVMGDISNETLALRAKTEKMWPLAVLKAKHSGRSVSLEIQDWIGLFVEQEREAAARAKPEKLILLKAMLSVRRCYEALSQNGFPEFAPLLHEVQAGIDMIGRLARRILMRRILLDTIDAAAASRCIKELSELIERGQWPNWSEEFQEVEDEVCADIVAGRARVKS
jgi:hypothetical protein